MEYTSLEQRMAGAYLAMLPAFVPKENAEVSVADQRVFYDIMKQLYLLLFEQPALIVPTLHPDDAFPTRYKKGYGKPALEMQVLKVKKAIETLLKNLFLAGQGAEGTLSKRQRHILSILEVDLAELPSAWTWMSNRPNADPVAFAYCLFDEKHVYTADLYARLLGETPFRRLEQWLLSHGYKPYDMYNTTWVNYQLSLTYANPAWGEERPNGGNEYKIKHTGISAQYDAYVREPAALGLCIPYGMKRFLECFDSMQQKVQAFVAAHTKECNGCGYCIQTDTTGARSFACIPVTYEQVEYKLCPYFPGYTFSWTSLNDELADNIMGMLAFMDRFAESARPRTK